jgi:hypothetical protein
MNKKTILLILGVLFFTPIFAQHVHLGQTYYNTLSYYSNRSTPERQYEMEKTFEAAKVYYFTSDKVNYWYFFGNDGYSYAVMYVPDRIGDVNAVIERYNNKYVIVSKNHWQGYLENGGCLDIQMIRIDSETPYVFIAKDCDD